MKTDRKIAIPTGMEESLVSIESDNMELKQQRHLVMQQFNHCLHFCLDSLFINSPAVKSCKICPYLSMLLRHTGRCSKLRMNCEQCWMVSEIMLFHVSRCALSGPMQNLMEEFQSMTSMGPIQSGAAKTLQPCSIKFCEKLREKILQSGRVLPCTVRPMWQKPLVWKRLQIYVGGLYDVGLDFDEEFDMRAETEDIAISFGGISLKSGVVEREPKVSQDITDNIKAPSLPPRARHHPSPPAIPRMKKARLARLPAPLASPEMMMPRHALPPPPPLPPPPDIPQVMMTSLPLPPAKLHMMMPRLAPPPPPLASPEMMMARVAPPPPPPASPQVMMTSHALPPPLPAIPKVRAMLHSLAEAKYTLPAPQPTTATPHSHAPQPSLMMTVYGSHLRSQTEKPQQPASLPCTLAQLSQPSTHESFSLASLGANHASIKLPGASLASTHSKSPPSPSKAEVDDLYGPCVSGEFSPKRKAYVPSTFQVSAPVVAAPKYHDHITPEHTSLPSMAKGCGRVDYGDRCDLLACVSNWEELKTKYYAVVGDGPGPQKVTLPTEGIILKHKAKVVIILTYNN